MTSKKTTRRALFSSIMALLLCCSMLVGTTFAWFTDSVTSSGNIIKSGTLDVEMKWANDLSKEVEDWTDASEGAIFDYKFWEPGYIQVKYVNIANVGDLVFKYQLNIIPDIKPVAGKANLADVIEAYLVPVADINSFAFDRAAADAFMAANEGATLSQLMVDPDGAAHGIMLPEDTREAGRPFDLTGVDPNTIVTGNATYCIVLHMQESAGNEYQNLTVGEGFTVQLLATQMTAEKDSFDNQYDAAAAWDGTIPETKPETLVVDTENKVISINDPAAFAYLNTLVENKSFRDTYGSTWQYTIELNTDVNLMGKPWTPIVLSNFVAFEGNGHTISNLNVSAEKYAGLFGEVSCNDIGVTYVRNLTIDGADVRGEKYVGALVGAGTQAAVENVTVNDATVVGVKYVGGIFGWGNGSVNNSTVKNSEIIIDTLVIDESDNSIDSKEAGGLIGYVSNDGNATTENKVIAGNTVENVTITAPSIASGLVAQPNSSNTGTGVIEIKNNTMKNVTITTTHDASADLYVSNNVGGKSIVANNTAVDCTIAKAVSNSDALKGALENDATVYLTEGEYTLPTLADYEGVTIIGGEGAVIGGDSATTGFGGNFGKNTTIKDVTFSGASNGVRYSYAKGGTSTFDNCTFAGDSTYGFHIDQSNGATFIFNNCTFIGFNAFAGDLEKVTFNNCTFLSNGSYGHTNIWSVGEFNNCTWGDNTSVGTRGDSAHLFFNGVEESYYHEFIGSADTLVAAFADLSAGNALYIVDDIDMTGKTITPVSGNKGFTMMGNGHTISNLVSNAQALFVAHSGSASYTFDGVVLEDCSVASTTNYGALFVGDGDTSDAITIKNCHVKNCSVNSAKYAAAFVAYTAGYDVVNNGPVYSDVLVENCSVTGGAITGGGSVGAAIGHAGGNVDTTTTVKNFKVTGTAINGEDAEHTGIVVGTAHVGETIIDNATYSNVTGNFNTGTMLYGRFVRGTTGSLTIDGVAK